MNDGESGKLRGRIHSFESCGTVDGPGLRYVVFLQGCPLRCVYCHNPDTFPPAPAKYDMTAAEVYEKIDRCRSFCEKGGVTLTGGEPLMQPAFVEQLFSICRKNRMHTAVDTSGFFLNEGVKAALRKTDLVLLDIKCIDPDIYSKITGQKLEPTLRFAEYLASESVPAWIRYVLVPGLTDDPSLVSAHADYVSSLRNVEKVEVLPYHEMAINKYRQLGLRYPLEGTLPPDENTVRRVRDTYRARGLKVD